MKGFSDFSQLSTDWQDIAQNRTGGHAALLLVMDVSSVNDLRHDEQQGGLGHGRMGVILEHGGGGWRNRS